jgi:FkbM family methyltransferase
MRSGMIRDMRHKTLKAVIHATERLVGRPRLAKLARLVTDEVRLDVQNDLTTNGESIVQAVALASAAPVVLDVGAHYGEWSESLLSQEGNQPTLHLFEPGAYSAARAKSVIGDRGEVHQTALSDRSGEGCLQIVHEGAGSNSVVPFTDSQRVSGQTEPITLTTMDDFCADRGIDRVRLLKVDAEGHDLAVMRGAERMLDRQAIDLVQFEYNHRWIDARVFLLDAFHLLQGHGYRVGKVTPRGIEVYERWHPELEKFVESNYLAFVPGHEAGLPMISWWGP